MGNETNEAQEPKPMTPRQEYFCKIICEYLDIDMDYSDFDFAAADAFIKKNIDEWRKAYYTRKYERMVAETK